ncbi:TetR/AcrR family transcriptional regulator [Paenibacillus filicis]|uniref:TetR/AcrR family transcriptional regulator n=1 Tax=Paenibacillus filicis TaxID=669464 RepID=A0ABU9DH91_9BACL
MVKKRTDAEDTKRRIVEKAGQLFATKGYNAVTMNEVCESAAVSKGSLYHHFPSKDELLLYVIEEDAAEWQYRWESLRVAHHSLEEQLSLLAEHYADDFQNPLSKALEEFARSQVISEDILGRILSINELTVQACRTLLEEGMNRGDIQSGHLDEKVMIVSSMLEGLGKMYYVYDRDKEKDKVKHIYRHAVHILLNGMRAGERP